MKWNYRDVEVTISEDGFFCFKIEDEEHNVESLSKAFEIIETYKNREYYNITREDLENLYKKLDDREKAFVRALIEELDRHDENPYCELGITDKFGFNIQK